MRRLDLSHERVAADTSQNGWMLREGAGRVWEKRIRRKTEAIKTAKKFAVEIATEEDPVILTIRRRFGHVQEERTYPRGYDPGRPITVVQPSTVDQSPELPPTMPEQPESEPTGEPTEEPENPETEPVPDSENVPTPEDNLEPVSA